MENKVICEIKWTVEDIRVAFENEYGRIPTEQELESCIDKINIKAMTGVCIERGWDFIYEVI